MSVTAPLSHGYESDLAALRAIVTLYSEASIDADRVSWQRSTETALLRRRHALERAKLWLQTIWRYAESDDALREALARPYPFDASRSEEAWERAVCADVLARLDGSMKHPLPESADLLGGGA